MPNYQINVSTPIADCAYPFLNILKTGSAWLVGGLVMPPTNVDSNGYPTALSSQATSVMIRYPTQTERPGNWVLEFDGRAWLDVGPVDSGTAQIDNRAGASGGRITFVPTVTPTNPDPAIDNANPQTSNFYYNAVGSPAPTFIRIFHEDDEDEIDAGRIFRQAYVDKLIEGGVKVLRFMPSGSGGNESNLVKWAHSKPINYFSYQATELRSSIYAGTTTADGANGYAVSAPSDWPGLVSGAMVTLKFHASASGRATNTGTYTLNVGGTGAKTIRRENGSVFHWNNATSNEYPLINRTATLVYDADLQVWMKRGGDDLAFDQGIFNEVPAAAYVGLCNDGGFHPWWNIPHFAAEFNTDYATQLATLARDNLDGGIVPRFEVANEVWNFAAGFAHSQYALNKAEFHWGAPYNHHNSYGKWVSRTGQLISAVYANDRLKYQMICAIQTYGDTSASGPRLTAERYVTVNGGSAAYNWATHVACATYFSPTYTNAQRASACTAFLAASDDAARMAVASPLANSVVSDGTEYPYSLNQTKVKYAYWKAWANTYSLGLTAYEGGYSPDYIYPGAPTGWPALAALSKRATVMRAHSTTNMENFLAEGGEYPSHFLFTAKSNAWSIFDVPNSPLLTDPTQSWYGALDFVDKTIRMKWA